MGTRNLTIVVKEGKTKIAQYGQWDGYPSGQGLTVLEFLRNSNLQAFKQKLEGVLEITEEELNHIDKYYSDNWKEIYPQLSRDMGAEILEYVLKNDNIKISNRIGFAKDSLFCEWAYVIDFDKNVFEVYTGFNKTPLRESDRFYFNGEHDDVYHPIKLVKSFDLSNLPTNEVFLELEKCEYDE